jgi:hypothetical protein
VQRLIHSLYFQLKEKYSLVNGSSVDAINDLQMAVSSLDYTSPGFIDSFLATIVSRIAECQLPADEVQWAVQRTR